MASSPSSTPLPPRSSLVFPTRAPSLVTLQHKHSDSVVVLSAIPSGEADITEADEQEARDEPAPKLHRAASVRRISLAAARKPIGRRYSVGEQTNRNSKAARSPTSQAAAEPRQSSSSEAEQQRRAQPGGTGGGGTPKGIMGRIQHTVALKRLSRSSLLPSPTGGFFAAAMAISAKEEAAGQQYEEMMERFQIRRLQHTGSVGSNSAGKVLPVSDTDGLQPAQGHSSTTPRSHASHSKAPGLQITKEQSRQTPAGSESMAQSSQAPVLVIKPRSSIQKTHEGMTKTAASGDSSSGRFSLYWKLVSWRRKLRRRGRTFAKRIVTPLSPFSMAARVRGFVLLLAFLSHAVYFPVSVAFTATGKHWFHFVDLGTEFVFMLDFVLSFNTSFQDKRGVLVTSRREIARNYLRGWCVPELLAAIPVESILYFRGEDDTQWSHVLIDGILRTQRLIHVVRILRLIWMVHAGSSSKSIWAWLIYSRYSHLVRIIWIVLLIVLLAHYMACCWKLLEDAGSTSSDFVTTLSSAEQYAANFYNALQLLQGQGLTTSTIGQSIFASLAVLLGSIVFAIVFGNVAMLVSNFNANSTNYQRKMEAVFAIMSKLQLPALLRERIHQYYEHLWRKYESLDGEIVKFSKDLTHNLALEVVLFKYMDLVLNVPFWRDCTPDFQKQIALSLQVRVYLPDDFILCRGEVGDEFYMINRGSCELSTGADSFEQATAPLNLCTRNEGSQSSNASPYANSTYYGQPQTEQLHEDDESEFDKRSRLKIERASDHDHEAKKKTAKYTRLLVRGQAFGEIALLMNYQRTANVRAVTYVEMCVLSRADFQRILTRYPDDRKHVLSTILITCMESNETRQVYCPLKAIVKLVFADGDARTADQISARYAANIISAVVNPDYEDDTMKFGIGMNFKKELKKLKAQDEAGNLVGEVYKTRVLEPSEQTSNVDRTWTSGVINEPPNSPPLPELGDRILKIEDTQMQTLVILQEMRAAMDELREIPTPVVHISTGADFRPGVEQQPSNPPSSETSDITNGGGDGTSGVSGGDAGAQSRSKGERVAMGNFPFLRRRSTTALDLLVLSQALAHEISLETVKYTGADVPDAPDATTVPPSTKRLRTEQPNQVNAKEKTTVKSQARTSFSRLRSFTLRDLTEKQKTELNLTKPVGSKPPPLAEACELTFQLRKKTSQPDMRPVNSKAKRNDSSLTKRMLLQQMGSLVSFMSTPTQQSPTCYADQLFHTRESSGDAAVHESLSSEVTQD